MQSLATIATTFLLGSFLLACGPVNRTIVFDGYLQPDSAGTAPLPSRLVLKKPTLAIESSCGEDCTWSGSERGSGEVHLGTDVARALGPQNVTDVDPSARYVADVDVRLREQRHTNGFAALQILLPLLAAAGSGAAAYSITPATHDRMGHEDNTQKVGAAVTGFALSWAIWYAIFGALPSNTVTYGAEARVVIRDRATNRNVVDETVSADYEDMFSGYSLSEKMDRASGMALRQIEPKVASLITLRMRDLPPAPTTAPALTPNAFMGKSGPR
jgi:hypothetical protein